MQLMSFVQVLLLLGLVAYLGLVSLENPLLVRLPLPLGQGEVTLPLGLCLALFALLGGLYAALLLLPPGLRERARRLREQRTRRTAEEQLVATLQARLGAALAVPAAPEPQGSDAAPAPAPAEEGLRPLP